MNQNQLLNELTRAADVLTDGARRLSGLHTLLAIDLRTEADRLSQIVEREQETEPHSSKNCSAPVQPLTGAVAIRIAREYFPDANEETLGYILWNHTGFPGFWKGDPETCLREQLRSYKQASNL